MSVKEQVLAIRKQIEDAAIRAGRDPKEILLCAATKMNDAAAVQEAIAAGVVCCGENRVQELKEKAAQNAYAGKPVHFIGHLQTNKVKDVVGKVDLIQSVDSLRLLQAVEKEAARQDIVQNILLEINIGAEASKSGFAPEELPNILEQASKMEHIFIRGLMAIPPICQKKTENHKFFQKMCNLTVDITTKKYDNVSMDILSMGMSGDFEDAIACGSTMVRLGTAIFGARNYNQSPKG